MYNNSLHIRVVRTTGISMYVHMNRYQFDCSPVMLMISKLTLPYSRCRCWIRAHTYSTLLHTLAVCHKLYISTYIQYVHLIAWPFHSLRTYILHLKTLYFNSKSITVSTYVIVSSALCNFYLRACRAHLCTLCLRMTRTDS